MPHKPHSGERDVARVVERQMRNWEIAGDARRRSKPADEAADRSVADFVTVSRAAGAGGSEVAAAIAEKLGWPFFDQEILRAMAGDDAVRQRLYESMDERDVGWYEETLRSLMPGEFPRNDYFHRLCQTILCLARKGNAVFLGRGADLILPRDRGLRVRIEAGRGWRDRQYAERLGVAVDEARREVDRVDREREEFLRRRFGVGACSPTRYDMVICRENFTTEQIVQLAVRALELRNVV